MMKSHSELIVDSEFRAAIPPLTQEELAQLRENILAEGIRDPLVLWAEHNTILDGHNRYEIACDYALSFQTAEVKLTDRDAALLWIIRNQLGRRNLHPDATSLLRGRMYNMQKTVGHGAKSGCQSGTQLDTADRLANEFGVSPRTIARDGALAEAVDALAPWEPDVAGRVMAGDLASRKVAIEAAKDPQKFYETTNARQDVAVTIFSSESNEYYTPAQYINAARDVMGSIDLDPATCEAAQRTIKAGRFYTEADDGFTKSWEGRVWLNPPYGKIGNESSQGQWAQRLVSEHAAGRASEGVVLVKAAVGYEWFELLWDKLPVCFARERISFIRANGNNDGQSKQGTAFFYVGTNTERFAEVFSKFGRIIIPEAQL